VAINFNTNKFDFLSHIDNNNKTATINHSSSLDSIGKLGKTPDLLSLNASLLPTLKSNASSISSRASFAESPLNFDNIKYLLRLVAGTIPLTSKLGPDSKNDGVMTSYPKDGSLPSSPKIYAINGIATNELTRSDMGNETSKLLGKQVNLINNSTEGPAVDLLECAKELYLGIPSKPTQTLASEIYKNLTQNPPQKMELIGYSQGTIMTTNAISTAIAKMKSNGYSDQQIKQLMSDNVKVSLVGCPVDLSNPAHVVANVPPGPATASTKRLDYYFTTEDRLLSGKSAPYGEKLNREKGAGELSTPNFEVVRHDTDVVATVIHDFGANDIKDLASNPVSFLGRLGAKLLSQTLTSVHDTLNPFGYHMYDNVYLNYMVDKKLVS
jgi:hypothetical protein